MGSLDSTLDQHQCSLECTLDNKEQVLYLRLAHTEIKLFRFRGRMPSSSMSCLDLPLVEEDYLTSVVAAFAVVQA
jgi:hypothetical protein